MTLGAFLAGATQGVNQGIGLSYMKRQNERAQRQEQREEEQYQWQKENRDLQRYLAEVQLDDSMTLRMLQAEDILSEAIDEGKPRSSQELAGALGPILEGEINQGGPDGSRKELYDLDAIPTDKGPVIVPKLNITYPDGTTAQKPMTENRSDDPNDQVVGFTIPQLMAARNQMRQRLVERLGQGALSKEERRRHIEALEALSGGSGIRASRLEAEAAARDRELEEFKAMPPEMRSIAFIARQRGFDIRTADGFEAASRAWRETRDKLGLDQRQESSFVQDVGLLRRLFPEETKTQEGLMRIYRGFKSDGGDRTLDGLKLINDLDKNREAAIKSLDPESFETEDDFLKARQDIIDRYEKTASEIRAYMQGGGAAGMEAGDPEADAIIDAILGGAPPSEPTNPSAPPPAAGMEWPGARPPLADAANAQPAPQPAPQAAPAPAAEPAPRTLGDMRAQAYASGARNVSSLSGQDSGDVGRSPQAVAYEQRRLQSQIPAAPEQKPAEQPARKLPESKAKQPAKTVDNRANRSRPLRSDSGGEQDKRMETLRQHGKENIARRQYVKNKDGTISTVRSITVQDPRLNGGKPTLIPTIWNSFKVSADRAIEKAVRSKKSWPAFDTIEQAAEAAKKLSQELDADLRRENVGTSR